MLRTNDNIGQAGPKAQVKGNSFSKGSMEGPTVRGGDLEAELDMRNRYPHLF